MRPTLELFLETNPALYPEFLRLARETRQAGYTRFGFGFIDAQGSTDGKALYFHICDVKDRAVLKPSDAVTFDVVQAPKGPKCINVRPTVVAIKETSHVRR